MAQIRASVDWENYIKFPYIMETKGLGGLLSEDMDSIKEFFLLSILLYGIIL